MRTKELIAVAKKLNLDQALVMTVPNIQALTGLNCDNAILEVVRTKTGRAAVTFYTDFRYVPMVHRLAPSLRCRDMKDFKVTGRRIGVEFALTHQQYLSLAAKAPKGAAFVDLMDALTQIRAVKTPEEIERLRASEALACDIWNKASKKFKAGMTEREMAAIIKKMMIDLGEGEAFSTIVCVGKNAAECHHEPDETVWNGQEPVLVDMGVKLNGVCSDLTRNLVVKPTTRYREVYELVKKANLAAIAAAKPGMTGRELDKVARDVIAKGGHGPDFGHSLGHGVGYEIHESPMASTKSETVLKPGMTVTIEPGIYLEGDLGVRIEDLVLITETGCEVLSTRAKK